MMSNALGFTNSDHVRPVRLAAFLMGIGMLLLLATPTSSAQQVDASYLENLTIEGNFGTFTREELLVQIRSRANGRFLGISGVMPGVWFYKLAGDGESGFANAVRRVGEAPAIYDARTLAFDVARLEALYQQEGFLDAIVHAQVDTLIQSNGSDGPVRVRVVLSVDSGMPTYVRSVRFEGLEGLRPDEYQQWLSASTLALQATNASPFAFSGVGQRFAERELLNERRALLDFLRHNGFALVNRDSINVVVFGMAASSGTVVARDSVDLVFRVNAGERFLFGDVAFVVNGPEVDVEQKVDSLALGDGSVVVQMNGERRLSSRLLRRALQFQPGEAYDYAALLSTKQRLERSGVFTFSDIARLSPDSSGGMLRAPHRISLRTRKRHSVRLEGFVLQRSGLLGVESDEIALGSGVSYRNSNLAGGGETFTLSTSGSVAGDFTEGFPTAQLEIGSTLTLPSLMPPFGFVERALRPFNSRTLFSLGFLTARREALGVIIRGRASAGLRLEIQHDAVRTSYVDLLDFALSDPDTLQGFSDRFLAFVDDPIARQFVLEDYTRPQVNNALRYTFRSTTANPFRRNRGHALDVTAELGGNLSYLLDRFVFTPDSLESSLPGLPFFGGTDENRLEYRPYARGLIDYRRYMPRGARTFAFKVIAGAAHPTGRSPVIPFDKRFYSGGASSVRGWNFRTLGPGGLTGEGVFVQGGDIKLEASAELRIRILRQFLRADWEFALFSDAGNVWIGPRNPGDAAGRFRFDSFYNEIGIGAGYGLRIGWDFLILRFDLGHKVHIPGTDSGLLPEGLRSPLFHFGIGQAF